MNLDLPAILASKRALRHSLASRDVLEKLRLLDALRERALQLRAARAGQSGARNSGRWFGEPPVGSLTEAQQ